MATDTAGYIGDAFDMLLEEIEAEIHLTGEAGAQAFQQRDYDRVRQALERSDRLAAFRDRVTGLRLDWEETFGPPPDTGDGDDVAPEAPYSTEDFRAVCIAVVEGHLGCGLVKRSATSYASPDGDLAVVCAVSKEYTRTVAPRYWFAFHEHWGEFLAAAPEAYLALGCGTTEQVLLIPYATFRPWLGTLNTTRRDDGSLYWHIHIYCEDDRLFLDRKKGFEDIDLTACLVG